MKPPTRHKLSLTLSAFLFLGGFGWVVATQGPLAPVKVSVARAEETTLQRKLFGIGTVEARRAYSIGPTAAGRVAVILVDQGDAVRAGQLLAEMDPVDLDARWAASSAAAARAGELVAAARAALKEADSRAQLAQTSATRFADLRRKNFVSQEAAETKTHEAAAARAAHEAASAALAAAEDEQRRARADLAATGKTRAHLRLTSPVDGVVSARLAEPGSTLVSGQAVVQLIDPHSLWLRVRIDQGRSAGLANGLPATVVLRSRPTEQLQGRVVRVDLVGDAVTEERIANVAFDLPPSGLALGELAEATLDLPPVEKVLAIPLAAVKHDGNGAGVWRLAEGRARFAPVATGAISADGMVEVRRGLARGDAVIVHSARAITADLRVAETAALVPGTRAAP